jgi:hypothetical protein
MLRNELSSELNELRNEKLPKELKLSDEAINSFGSFTNLSSLERENLKDLVFNLSLVLYKSFKNE